MCTGLENLRSCMISCHLVDTEHSDMMCRPSLLRSIAPGALISVFQVTLL